MLYGLVGIVIGALLVHLFSFTASDFRSEGDYFVMGVMTVVFAILGGVICGSIGFLTMSNADRERSGTGNGRILFGVFAMVVSALWFIGGLAVRYIFFNPPFLFIGGVIAVVKGAGEAGQSGQD